ncbi:hypothetical protein PSQ90_01270 [Devosia rhodophyticola]|uniref:Uncharacterized protein n=1 Tax=Devosia rhodophyticola TaxID=3026423 RepID=A0ABY7YXM3_9HYPH|nr:hypothetical protein [Devosia rhodophyticola]WDR06119.1 hypothetical protein PSQ90_01270 [Devosia rhodophyticola]
MARIDDVLKLVGQLNYVWTNTESLFIYLIEILTKTNKEAAIVIFLTLNTTRSRIDLLERLSKTSGVSSETRSEIAALMSQLKKEAKLRNKYNHCIYSFDASGEFGTTQLMRIAEFNDNMKYGKVESLDDDEVKRIQSAITSVTQVNKDIWRFIHNNNIAA